ncbi:MAG TPA: DNA polymerase ligase N-terminal domain-containing protein [Candidatus Binatia bacterium]|nr:DNA polymerase ligase N-terminal domain-containing protein [Candidatus Binatia bacterium]
MANKNSLKQYRSKRDFRKSPEPSGTGKSHWKKDKNPIFVIQEHDASRLHYDFRVEIDGVLKSWAVPKGPSTDPREKRLAVQVEDHPLKYADFEGVIPEGHYGAGSVIVWDAGPYRNLKKDKDGKLVPMSKAMRSGKMEIWLGGKKVRGGYALIQSKLRGKAENWLLIKMKDEASDARRNPVKTQRKSVLTGRTLEETAKEARQKTE